MTLFINGEHRTIKKSVNVIASLLEQLAIPPARTAVELNGAVIEQHRFGETALQDGDRIEIVSFVGGG